MTTLVVETIGIGYMAFLLYFLVRLLLEHARTPAAFFVTSIGGKLPTDPDEGLEIAEFDAEAEDDVQAYAA